MSIWWDLCCVDHIRLIQWKEITMKWELCITHRRVALQVTKMPNYLYQVSMLHYLLRWSLGLEQELDTRGENRKNKYVQQDEENCNRENPPYFQWLISYIDLQREHTWRRVWRHTPQCGSPDIRYEKKDVSCLSCFSTQTRGKELAKPFIYCWKTRSHLCSGSPSSSWLFFQIAAAKNLGQINTREQITGKLIIHWNRQPRHLAHDSRHLAHAL